jgi:hypothetical protein
MAKQKETNKRSYKRNPKRELAELLYVEAGMLQKEIALELDIGEHTIGRWKDEDNWDLKKQVKTLSPENLIKQFYEQSELIVNSAKNENRPLNSKECDALNKLASSIQKIDKRTDPSIIMNVLVQFNNYLKTMDLELAKAILPYQKQFILQKLGNEN